MKLPAMTAGSFTGPTNGIHEANEAVEALAEKYHLGFLDLNAPLMDEKGRLKAEFTIDGVHMYPNGYREVWKQLAGILQ